MRQPFDCHMLHVTCNNTGVIVHCNAAEGRAAHVAGVCIVAVDSMNLFDAALEEAASEASLKRLL